MEEKTILLPILSYHIRKYIALYITECKEFKGYVN